MAETELLGVVGAGLMGSEIAFLGAAAGIDVRIHDLDAQAIAAGVDRARSIAARRVAKGRLSEDDAAAISARLNSAPALSGLKECSAVIEAVSENMDVKAAVFWDLERALSADALIASNTSGLSITDLGRITSRPERVVGMHFFNPASVMPLVEVIHGEDTAPQTMDEAVALATTLGKTPVRVKECPGFLVNRILVCAMLSAYRSAEARQISPGEADAAIREQGPAPMGPYALGDLVGLDTLLSISRHLEKAYGEIFAQGETLPALVGDGALGGKSGRGFDPDPEASVTTAAQNVATAYYEAAFQEATRCLDDDIAPKGDIDLAMTLGAGWEHGPFEWSNGAAR